MFRTCLTLLLASASCVLPARAADRVAEQLFPKTMVLYAEIPNPSALISAIFDHPLRAKLEALEPYKQAVRSDAYRAFLTGRKFVEIQLGMEWREALETVLAKGVYVGVDGATQGVAVLIRAKDAPSLELFRSKLLEISKMGKNPDQIKEGEYRGISAYEINKTKLAIVDDWLLITNKPETGKAFLDRFIDGPPIGESLADNETFQQARQTQPRKSTGWGFADLKTLRDAGIAKKLYGGKSDNPVIELLAGGILSTLQHTPFATLRLTATHTEFGFELSVPHSVDWITEEREYYFGLDGTGRGPALPAVDNTLFTLSTYRDMSEMWLRAGDLFDERINDGFAEADANLTTFFSGKDFGEDILGSLTPQIGLIASKQNFDSVLPVPTIKLPQFALVLELKEPETMTRELRRTFQSMIGFFNVIGAMAGRPQLEMDIDKLDSGAELITSTYIPEDGEAKSTSAPLLFNFSPSVGFAKERFVVASTDRLARELVESGTVRTDQNPLNTAAQLKADVLKDILSDNREQLISQNMLEEGHSRDEAENAINLLLELVGYFEDASVKLDTQHDALSLQIKVQIKSE